MNKVIKTNRKCEGLLEVNLEHEILKTTGTMRYDGPKIPSNEWHQVMSFFRWCQETYHSECQVRWFVNTVTRTWKPWAFPQKARTGMTAQELDTDDVKEQRAQFPDSEGWLYFGTVHHHCNGTAFQSGVDRGNEETQDGIHITVGKMNDPEHDIHVRFYLNGDCFDPDMSTFWDIGLADGMVPPKIANDIARYQMTRKVEILFPEQWKQNIIEIKSVPAPYPYSPTHTGGTGVGFTPAGSGNGGATGSGSTEWRKPEWRRAQEAIDEMMSQARIYDVDIIELEEEMEYIDTHTGTWQTPLSIIMRALHHHKVEFDEVMREWATYGAVETLRNAPGVEDKKEEPKKPEQQQQSSPTGGTPPAGDQRDWATWHGGDGSGY